MFDGIKIDCRGCDPLEWVKNDLLTFIGSFNYRTGEILRQPITAKHEGLTLKIIPSTVSAGKNNGVIQGSLHKYFNKGVHNSNDFHLSELSKVISGLYNDFHISKDSQIRNLEFGVNIEIPITAKELLKKVVSNPKKKLLDFHLRGFKIGKIYSTDQYELKIYDKAAHDKADKEQRPGKSQRNILRIEIKVKEMKFFEPYNIKQISDLEDITKICGLGKILSEMFDNLIINDFTDIHRLSPKRQSRIKDYINPLFWEGLTFNQRHKHRKQFKELLTIAGNTGIQNTITNLIINKWENLLEKPQKKGEVCGNFMNDKPQIKKARFAELECSPQTLLFEEVKKAVLTTLKNANKTTEKKMCKICARDITTQKAGSLFCSELIYGRSCRNKGSNAIRQQRQKIKKENEKKMCEKLHKPKQRQRIEHCHLTKTTGETITVKPDEIIFNPAEARKINRIEFTGIEPPGILTTMKAKEFIKYMTDINYERTKREKRQISKSNKN